MKVKKSEIFTIYETIKRYSKTKHTKLSFTLSRNKKKIEDIYKKIIKLFNYPKDFSKYEDERIQLAKDHAKVYKGGEPVMNDQGGYEIEDKKAYEEEINLIEGGKSKEKRQKEISIKYSKKRKKGEKVTTVDEKGNTCYVLKDEKKFDKDFNKLKETYKYVFDEMDENKKKLDAMLQEEVEINFLKLPLNAFPKNLDMSELERLDFMLSDDTKDQVYNITKIKDLKDVDYKEGGDFKK